LWFANGAVLQMIDPAHMSRNPLPPPVHIEEVIADRRSYALPGNLRLPPITRDLEIDYTALSFMAPQKVRFRYRLEGHDVNWQKPGSRRQAFYSDLPPGKYHFHVMACNNDGVWNEAGASLDFSIAPAWYQAIWFRISCVGGFVLLLWALYQLRLQQLQRQFNMTVEARVGERTRIARDLHDTLLQSVHGLMFQFQAVRNLMPRRPDEAIRSLDDAMGDAKKALAESRNAIQGLRLESIAQGSLAELLTATSRDLADAGNGAGEPPKFDLIEEGEPRTLSPSTENEICRIALEILRNAYQHAQAHRIEAEVRYGDQSLRLRIRDDGKGIDSKVLRNGGRAGHWGLRGVRERAERIGAQVDFWSEPGTGTEVQVEVPASIAYEMSRGAVGSRLLWKVRNRGHRSKPDSNPDRR
jgi:signal transduction histidine kinase